MHLDLSRVVATGALLTGTLSVSARHRVAPNACKFVSVAEVTTLIGKTVGGGQMSIVDNPNSLTSSCTYTVTNIPTVIVMVGDYPSPAAAKQEFATEMAKSKSNASEAGIGDAAFWTPGDAVSITALHRQRVATIAVVGGAPTLHDRIHSLIATALSR